MDVIKNSLSTMISTYVHNELSLECLGNLEWVQFAFFVIFPLYISGIATGYTLTDLVKG